ncbi:MAG: NAD(P)/FAD-dependent oxidoreductase [Geminicoccales bacterium]
MSGEIAAKDVFDVAVIGAGVVGCAMARRFVMEGARVLVLEKAADVLDGASKGNSAILHTGFDAPPGSLEQACIADGYREFLAIRERLGLPLLESGALVLAWTPAELDELEGLMAKAHANGVSDVRPLTREQIIVREPNLSAKVQGGFIVPGEFVIDPWSTPHAYLLQALANGAELRRGAEVLAGEFDGGHWRLSTLQGEVKADQVIACAGLYGDQMDERFLGQKSFAIKPRKGQFLVFDKAASALASSIILPVPSETTKGVVICRTVFGNLLVGPTAEEQESRVDASTDGATLNFLLGKGIEMIPDLAASEVTAAYAGIRPATEHKDYQIIHDTARHYTSVGGIRSTGLSAALGIAKYVAELQTNKTFKKSPMATIAWPKVRFRLSSYDRRDWEEPGHNGMVCHCELVTRREIEAALEGPMGAASLDGLKRRTRVTMGRCQGFYCQGPLSKIVEGRFDPPMADNDAA